MMWSNPAFFLQAMKHLKAEYFGQDFDAPGAGYTYNPLKILFALTVDLYKKYKMPATPPMFRLEISKRYGSPQNAQLVGWYDKIQTMQIGESLYLKDALTTWLRRHLTRDWIHKMVSAHNRSDDDHAAEMFAQAHKEIALARLDPPDRSAFFEEADERRERRRLEDDSDVQQQRFGLGIVELDRHVGGGIKRGELGLIMGDTNVGKSVSLVNIGAVAVMATGARVLHIVLEGSREQCEDRYEARILGVKYSDVVKDNLSPGTLEMMKRQYQRYAGQLVIRRMAGSRRPTVLDIEEELHRCSVENFEPDLVCLDYADILQADGNAERDYIRVREVYRGLKSLAERRNIGIWTASQVAKARTKGRENDSTYIIRPGEASEGYDKIRIADIVLTLNQTAEEKDKRQLRLYLAKARDHKSKFLFHCTQDLDHMIMANPHVVPQQQQGSAPVPTGPTATGSQPTWPGTK